YSVTIARSLIFLRDALPIYTVQENVNAARVVKAYVRADHEDEKFRKISGIVYKLFTKAEKIVSWNNPVMMFTMYVVILAMVYIRSEEHTSELQSRFDLVCRR